MVNKVGSQNKTPYVFATLGAGIGAVGGAKMGLSKAEKYISKNLLPPDEFVKKRIGELTELVKEKFPEEKVADKIKDLPKIAQMEYDVVIHRHKVNTKNAFAIVGGVLLASLGYLVSKLIIDKNKGPKLATSLDNAKVLSGYNSTTARYNGGRYSSTTA